MATQERFIHQGFVTLVDEPVRLISVVGTGIIITAFHSGTSTAGICNFSHPRRIDNQSTAVFAAPAIFSLMQLFKNAGINTAEIEVQIYGGAENKHHIRYNSKISQDNVIVAEEILNKMNVQLIGKDVGGPRARKIIFHSGTGETIVAKVDKVRDEDWYPHYIPSLNQSFSTPLEKERRKQDI